ncbi:UDP-N-acetylmuramoyl-L-alanine--D-glutamate ligase [Moraxella nasovis]|uniref:UDP-N-acetylmuramoyl-L-alanine--D-glutamate ligase n=1 Tax=Moraxella nasovis TaxID=2904121 RepID=UPI001F60FED9|nr:UDP-N-acetylmuramoyl-L-alanine--D-glutamate ligase [Moraxella nasovis]UNU73975.1 UDP-N-acetylmuramoyl-L-alanine--D-glutamate ligase [Moraxella nasovis]
MRAVQRYAVIGLGGSGLSAINFLVEQGFDVVVTDESSTPNLACKLPKGVQTAFGGIDKQALMSADRIVISPGVNPSHHAIQSAKKAGIEVISDVALFIETLKQTDASQGKHTPVVAITGSNAKSTVTTLVAEMAKTAGKVVGVGGNIGTPALELLKIDNLELAVLELSSFQLEHLLDLGASVATILNLSADHLDRHGDMAGYLAEKLHVFEQAKAAVICVDDVSLAMACRDELDKQDTQARIITTSGVIHDSQTTPKTDFYLARQQGVIYLCHDNNRLISADELQIKGSHNLLNVLSAFALSLAVDIPIAAMVDTVRDFKGLPHRCEYVCKIGNKAYFNDSKGTNIGSTIAAIIGLGEVYGERSLALILGGLAKGQDFSEIAPFVEQFVHSVYLIGQDAPSIRAGLLSVPSLQDRLVDAKTLQTAVQMASQSDATAVLLSPACASFDQFSGYAQRGECFVKLVQDLSC